MMPGIDGFEVLETIRGTNRTARIPVLILTARNLDRNDLKRLSANNVQQLVQKGAIDLRGLLRKISLMLQVQNPADIGEQGRPQNKIPSLLIVEDNPDNLLTLRAILGEQYKIEEQTDGEGGLKAALQGSYDAILLDIALPKLSGTEILQQIRKNERLAGIPVIAVTARAMKGDEEELLSAGFDAYISKPVDGAKLLNILQSILR